MEMDGVPAANVVGWTLNKIKLNRGWSVIGGCFKEIIFKVIKRHRFVGAAEAVETSVVNLNIQLVHEHDVSTIQSLKIFRFKNHVAGSVGDPQVQVSFGWYMVEGQGLIKRHDISADGRNGSHFIARLPL